jgi:hypothetical protein
MRKEFGSQDCSYMSFPDMICSAEAGQKAELGGEATRPGADSKMSELVAWTWTETGRNDEGDPEIGDPQGPGGSCFAHRGRGGR